MPIFGRRVRHSPYMGSVVTALPSIHINARWRQPGFPALARRGASIPPVPSTRSGPAALAPAPVTLGPLSRPGQPRRGGSRAAAAMKVTSLDCRQLRKLLRKEPSRCLVLDCRPYLSYSASCLRGSLNVNLNSVVMRRARGGAVPLHFVVPDAAARSRLLLGSEGAAGAARLAAVVVLDQGTGHWQKLKKDSTAQIVLNALLSSLPEAGARVCFLKGEGAAGGGLHRRWGIWGIDPRSPPGSGPFPTRGVKLLIGAGQGGNAGISFLFHPLEVNTG